nr:hypothetical protein [uncultured Capnocytophaga sp.]
MKKAFYIGVMFIFIGVTVYRFVEDMKPTDTPSFIFADAFLMLIPLFLVLRKCWKEMCEPDD